MPWLAGLDLGNVPSWLTLLTVVIGVVALRRERNREYRRQIDDVAIWYEPNIDSDSVEEDRLGYLVNVRNSSKLPVFVYRIKPAIDLIWEIPVSADGSNRRLYRGDPDPKLIPANDIGIIPPGSDYSLDCVIDLEHCRPADDAVLEGNYCVSIMLDDAILKDNVGRLWQFRARSGKPPKRIRGRRSKLNGEGSLMSSLKSHAPSSLYSLRASSD